jgi:Alginate export
MLFAGRVLVASLLCCGVAHAADEPPAAADVAPIKILTDVRARYESVDQDGFAQDAAAETVRARFGVETAERWRTSLLVEAEVVHALREDYNSTLNGLTTYPGVSDPEGEELNRAYFTNKSLPNTTLTLGRQRLVLDEGRFVGNAGWRQNEQTFDALRAVTRPWAKVTVDASYVSQVNRVVGPDSPVGRYHGDNALVHVGYSTGIGTVTGFAYLLELEEAPLDSTATYGARFAGSRAAFQNGKLAYVASYASQRERANNPLVFANDAFLLEVTGTTARGISIGGGLEVLEGDGVKGFGTPLAGMNKFHAGTDKFLGTPPGGLEDLFVTFGYVIKPAGAVDSVTLTATAHDFEAERGNADYGDAWQLQGKVAWGRFTMTGKYVDYDARGFSTDTTKLALQLEYFR